MCAIFAVVWSRTGGGNELRASGQIAIAWTFTPYLQSMPRAPHGLEVLVVRARLPGRVLLPGQLRTRDPPTPLKEAVK